MTLRSFALIHIFLFIIVAIFSTAPWPYSMLTIAQLLYVPIALHFIMKAGDFFSVRYFYFAGPAYIAISILQLTLQTSWDGLLAAIYLIFTVMVAAYGANRFFQRGFTHLEEFSIDMGLIYLAMGGGWFFVYEANIETSFSPLITWLTAIHFHYSAFLLPIFVGFLGRLYKPPVYKIVCSIILLSPMIVAVGITFSRWIELLSVLIYIIGIYGLIIMTLRAPFPHRVQKWLVCSSFSTLGITIVFPLLFALGNVWGLFSVSIEFMLRFHGVLNCIIFALLGIIGWSRFIPPSPIRRWSFPVSKIRGKKVIGQEILTEITDNQTSYRGLVESMALFKPKINCQTLSPAIIDFYENTTDYRLFAKVEWSRWFKPFAALYRMSSRYVKQINLPLHDKQIEMDGDIFAIQATLDGRSSPRAWLRKIGGDVAFVALYSFHRRIDCTYMNIALPLPWSSMIGILELEQMGTGLRLSSKKLNSPDSDAGIYIASGKKRLMKLPLEEDFFVEEVAAGNLKATHKMWIFSIPFLTIYYEIYYSPQHDF